MGKKPRVSIGLPVYNGEKYLEEALDSIIAQTFTNFDLIIADNASTDRTDEICRAYAARDQRIHYYRQDWNLGAAPNYNFVFDHASGEYFKWAAHDDMLAIEYLYKCVEVLDQNPDVVLCFTQAKMIDEYSKNLMEATYEGSTNSPKPHYRFRNLALDIQNAPKIPLLAFGLMRTGVVNKTGLIGNYPSSDVVFIAELALYGQFYEIPEPLFLWRNHPSQSVKGELASDRGRAVWFDSSLKDKIFLHKWMYLFGYVKAINRSPIGIYGKLYSYLQIFRWALMPSNFRSIVKDVLLAVKELMIRTFLRLKETTAVNS